MNNGLKKALIPGLLIISALFYPLSFGKDKPESLHTGSTEAVLATEAAVRELCFRNERLLNEHYEEHGIEMGFKSAKEYEKAAAAVAASPDALHKLEKEDGDDVYYIEKTNEFVIVSTDGYIRTYFCPDAGIRYYNKQ